MFHYRTYTCISLQYLCLCFTKKPIHVFPCRTYTCKCISLQNLYMYYIAEPMHVLIAGSMYAFHCRTYMCISLQSLFIYVLRCRISAIISPQNLYKYFIAEPIHVFHCKTYTFTVYYNAGSMHVFLCIMVSGFMCLISCLLFQAIPLRGNE